MAEDLIYNVPLRREWLKVPRYRRTKKSVKAVREFISKHTKVDDVRIGRYLNLKLWEHGRKNPPGKITVKVVKEKDFVKVELPDAPEEKKEEVKKKGIFAKRKERIEAEIKEQKADEHKAEEEKEKKEILEHPPKERNQRGELGKQKEERPEVEEKIREEKIVKRTQRKDKEIR